MGRSNLTIMDYSEQVVSGRVAELLGLQEGFEQSTDWDLIDEDADRVHHFLDVYETGSLTDPEKQVVMQLIVASYDAWLNGEREADPAFELKLREHLAANPDLHDWVISYWAAMHRPDEKGWKVTPIMREIAKSQRD